MPCKRTPSAELTILWFACFIINAYLTGGALTWIHPMHILFLFISIALGVVAQMLFKSFAMAPKGDGQALFWYFLNTKFIAGMGLYFVAAILYIVSLQKINLSVAHPTVAVSYIFVVGLSHVFFGESLTVYKILGSAFILTGVALMWKQ
jgi:drug/metabolite transporter (DMT)-like permease